MNRVNLPPIPLPAGATAADAEALFRIACENLGHRALRVQSLDGVKNPPDTVLYAVETGPAPLPDAIAAQERIVGRSPAIRSRQQRRSEQRMQSKGHCA